MEGLSEWQMPYDDALALRLEGGGDTEEETRILDNQNWALRQHLLYHMLNYTLSPASFLAQPSSLLEAAAPRKNITTLTTLLYPLAKEPKLPRTPEPGSPWLPRGGEGMLGGHGQRLRLARAGSEEGGERGRVGCDWHGDGGATIWDGKWGSGNDSFVGKAEHVQGAKWTSNGVVVGVDAVLDMPGSIGMSCHEPSLHTEDILRSHPSLSYLSSLLPPTSTMHTRELPSPLPANLSTTEHLTIFVPANEAFDRFDEVEKRYLEGDFGGEAIARVMGGGVVTSLSKEQVGWSDYWGKKADSGESLQCTANDSGDCDWWRIASLSRGCVSAREWDGGQRGRHIRFQWRHSHRSRLARPTRLYPAQQC